jgi:glutamate racemase
MGQVKEQRIGIFDSGIGGFSILKEIHKKAPHIEAFYIADEAFAPYGEKSESEVISRSRIIVAELLKNDIDLVVVACNTATAFAIDTLREEFDIPFVGVEPFVNAISKYNLDGEDKACVITTELMSKSKRFDSLKSKYDKSNSLTYFVTKNLATIVEHYYLDKDINKLISELKVEFSFLNKESYKYIILGCTHYPLLAKEIEDVTGLQTISPCPFVADRVVSLMSVYDNNTDAATSFCFSKTISNEALRFVSKDFSSLP